MYTDFHIITTRRQTLLICLLTPWNRVLEATRFVTSQEGSRVLVNTKFHYRIHKCPPPVSILSQPNPVHTPHPTS
jgi:hypothetical protein